MTSIETIFILLVAFQIKHFIADFPLQTKYHLQKFLPDWRFVLPLASHCSIHAVGTWFISVAALWHTQGWHGLFAPFGLAAFDFGMHFTMDRVKASPNLLGRFKDTMTPQFWWCLGFDQGVHHLTHYTIVYYLVKHGISA
jgi:hypothetical protein